jgi:hypothetical protein
MATSASAQTVLLTDGGQVALEPRARIQAGERGEIGGDSRSFDRAAGAARLAAPAAEMYLVGGVARSVASVSASRA